MQNEKDANAKVVETYTADMARTINGSEGIYIKKIIEEHQKKEDMDDDSSPSNIKNKSYMFLGIFLIFSSIGALLFLFFLKKDISVVEVAPQFNPIIYLDNSEFIEVGGLTKDQIFQSVRNMVFSTKVKQGGVEGIYITYDKQILGLRKFLSLIPASVDQSTMDFISDNFLIGITNTETKDLFILLKVRSFTDAFNVMHPWENKIFNDMHGFFGVDVSPENKYLLTKSFEDGIVQNKNARILKDNDGKIIMMYVFGDENSLIITNNENSAREVLLRISSGLLKK